MGIAVACIAHFVPGFAAAQSSGPADATHDAGNDATNDAAVTAAARALAIDGVKLAQADQCGEAIDKLERAEQLHHSPIVLAQLGECYVKLGRLVEGVESLRSVTREPLPPNPSEAMRDAYATSKTLLEATRVKLASLTISVDELPQTEAVVTIDDKPVPPALLGASRPTDPGGHTIKARAPGYLTSVKHVTLAPGEAQAVTLALVMDPAAPRSRARVSTAPTPIPQATRAPEVVPPPPSAAPAQAISTEHGSFLPAYIAWGAAAIALGVGVGFGVAALADQRDLERQCPDKRCTPAQNTLLDDARLHATLSTVGFGAAVGGAIIGGVLFYGESRSSRPEIAAEPRLAARVGVASANLTLTF